MKTPVDFCTQLRALATKAPTETPADSLPRLRKLLENVLRAEHEAQRVPWSNLSASIGFVAYQQNLSHELKTALHRLRVAANLVLHESYAGTSAEVLSGLTALNLLLKWLTGAAALPNLLLPPALAPAPESATVAETAPVGAAMAAHALPAAALATLAALETGAAQGPDVLVQVLGFDRATGELLVEPDPAYAPPTGNALRVRLPDDFKELTRWVGLKPALLLLDVRPAPDGSGALTVRRVVLEPDYLINVTTVAECMQRDGGVPELALIKAFMPDETTRPLVVGNLVNVLLDEEVREAAAGRHLEFDTWKAERLFRQNPLQLSALADFNTSTGVTQLVEDLRRHHRTLRATLLNGFRPAARSGYVHQALRPEHCFLEPAFLSARYGLQGRLDLLHESEHGYDLIELKSSANVPQLEPWENHRAQAHLYRLLLEGVFPQGENAAPDGSAPATAVSPSRGRTSILYSNADPLSSSAVRPVLRDDQFVDRLLNARNALVARELMLAACRTPAEVEQVLRPVLHPGMVKLAPYDVEKADKIANAWAEADAVERAYALELVRFTARELRLTMLGDEARAGDGGGQSGLWRAADAQKEQNFSLLDHLELLADHSSDEVAPHLLFRRPAVGAEVNFRPGESLLLYPRTRKSAAGPPAPAEVPDSLPTEAPEKPLTALDSQVVKVALEEITPETVRVSVRNRRIAPEYLARHQTWALEPDTYDTFRREWAATSAFLKHPAEKRGQLLGRTGPRPPADWQPGTAPARDSATVVARALAAPDWFLLCGPPGTGKTRKVLRTLAESLYQEGKNTLLAAYTNRAVDEICEQLVKAGLPFIRIGSRLSTEEPYRSHLLDARLSTCRTRVEVRNALGGCPIYVGTVSALQGKSELFSIKQFDVLVVDEASQILESPMLALLARVPKWILIGDHKQLPAVVAQTPEASAVAAPVADLLRDALGLTNLRNSYFERLFRLAERQWPWAHGTLAAQYRMHQEINALVNHAFYGGVLTLGEPARQAAVFDRSGWPALATLNHNAAAAPAASFTSTAATDLLPQVLRQQRLLFWPTRRCPEDGSAKESRQEARLAARLAAEVAQGYGAAFDPALTVGIIASYRNQVALIRRELAREAEIRALPALLQITVDTVERYQGSQREVIIVSFCCHFEYQLEMLVSLDETSTVDRKLNVALTRAREQLILLGNEEILSADPRYRLVLEQFREAGAWQQA